LPSNALESVPAHVQTPDPSPATAVERSNAPATL
jgi:hypothetical protein